MTQNSLLGRSIKRIGDFITGSPSETEVKKTPVGQSQSDNGFKKKRRAKKRSVHKRHNVPEFNTTVKLDDSAKEILSQVFTNHNQCNQLARTLVRENPDITPQKLKERLYRFVEENNIEHFIPSTLNSELIYIRKKILEGKNPRSGNTSYISLTGNSAANEEFTFNVKRNMFMIESLGLMLKLDAPAILPEEGVLFHISIGTTNVKTLEDIDFNIYFNTK